MNLVSDLTQFVISKMYSSATTNSSCSFLSVASNNGKKLNYYPHPNFCVCVCVCAQVYRLKFQRVKMKKKLEKSD